MLTTVMIIIGYEPWVSYLNSLMLSVLSVKVCLSLSG